jgi:UDP-glucose 4-epimerase
MKSLITGGAGFIGSHVAKHCLYLGHKVIVFDDLSGGFEDHVPSGADLVVGSVTDCDLVNQLFIEHQFDYVYHLAAYAAEGLSHFIRHFNYQNNLIGSINLINAAVNSGAVKRFVFTSSIAVYGSAPPPMTEDMTPMPEDPYGVAKYAVELDLKLAHEMFGLDYTVFRPHNVYGENQNIGDRYRNVIGIFMNQIMQGQPLTVFGDGKQTRAFSYIDDVAPIIARSVDVPEAANQIFNIGATTPYSILELAQAVGNALGVEPEVKHLEARMEVVHAYASHAKCERVFEQSSYVDLQEGVQRMAKWAKATGARRSKLFEGVEVLKNMPPSWQQELASNARNPKSS